MARGSLSNGHVTNGLERQCAKTIDPEQCATSKCDLAARLRRTKSVASRTRLREPKRRGLLERGKQKRHSQTRRGSSSSRDAAAVETICQEDRVSTCAATLQCDACTFCADLCADERCETCAQKRREARLAGDCFLSLDIRARDDENAADDDCRERYRFEVRARKTPPPPSLGDRSSLRRSPKRLL